ncbi:unnamed protein product [Urochloa humidicola]
MGQKLSHLFAPTVTKWFSSLTIQGSQETLKNAVLFSLNGSKYHILLSFINAVIHYRIWNITKGTCVNATPFFGKHTELYTTSCDDTFHFVVEFEDDIIDIIVDGPTAWMLAILKKLNSFRFQGDTVQEDYMKWVDSLQLEFTGHYKYVAKENDAGKVPIGLAALKKAFKLVLAFDGKSSPDFQIALGTFVAHFGEAPKFHKVLLACCMGILNSKKLQHNITLDSYDSMVGKMVRNWVILCEIAVGYVLKCLLGGTSPSLDEELQEIKRLNIPNIKTLRDIFDNICIWTSSSPYKKKQVEDERPKGNRLFKPIDYSSDDEYSCELINFYRKKMSETTDPLNTCKQTPSFEANDGRLRRYFTKEVFDDAKFAEKDNGFHPWKMGIPHKVVTEFLERRRHLFHARSYQSSLTFHCMGPKITKESLANRAINSAKGFVNKRWFTSLSKAL